jgi:protein O-mannosyl-transferase
VPKRGSPKPSQAKASAEIGLQEKPFGATAGKWLPSILILFGAAAYFDSLHAPFIFDDRFHIVENTRIRQLWPSWPYLLHTSRPVIYLSLALNYAIGRLDPLGYHVFNAAVHIAAALVLYGILRRTFLSTLLRPRFGAAAQWIAGLTALIWLVHPIQTESVTYTIQRGESLMGLFYLLTLYCVIRAHVSPHRTRWYAAAVASCCAGIGCKGVMLTAPVVALLYDRVFLSPSWGTLVKRKWGLYAALAAAWLLYPVLLSQAPAEWKESSGFEYAGAAPFQYAMTQPAVILHYLQLVFWPDKLCLDYGWPAARTVGEVLPQLIIVGGLLAATIWAWRRQPAASFAGAWFFIILIPTSSFIPIADLAAEHRMYLSLAAAVALAVAGLFLAMRRLGVPAMAWAAGAVMALLLTVLTARRNLDYASELAIWQDTVDTSPGNPRAQYDLAHSLEVENRPQEAIAHYQKALEEKPDYVDALNNLGHVLSVSGKPQDAAVYLQRAIQLKPGLAEAHFNLGYADAQQGSIKDAIAQLEEAVRIKPDFGEAHNNLGIALAMDGRTREAIDHWQQALKLDPDSADTHNNLAYALSQSGGMREAIAHYESALRLKPDYVQAQDGLAKLLATLGPGDGGDPNRAIELASRACANTGNRVAGFLETLATSYAAARRFDDAVKTAQNAVDVARAAGQPDVAREIEARMNRYRHGG